MKARELRDLTPDELIRKLDEATKEVFTLRLKLPGQQPNTARLRAVRRDVARVKGVLAEKGIRL